MGARGLHIVAGIIVLVRLAELDVVETRWPMSGIGRNEDVGRGWRHPAGNSNKVTRQRGRPVVTRSEPFGGLPVAGFGICKTAGKRVLPYPEAEQLRNYVDMKIVRAEHESFILQCSMACAGWYSTAMARGRHQGRSTSNTGPCGHRPLWSPSSFHATTRPRRDETR